MKSFPNKATTIIGSACFVLLNLISIDACAVTLIWNSGVWGDTWQASSEIDTDGDGVLDNAPDNCPLISNTGQENNDNDSEGDVCDSDDDNDDLSDEDEAIYGTNPFLTDSDGDGIDDNVEVTQGRNPAVNEAVIIQIINSAGDEE